MLPPYEVAPPGLSPHQASPRPEALNAELRGADAVGALERAWPDALPGSRFRLYLSQPTGDHR